LEPCFKGCILKSRKFIFLPFFFLIAKRKLDFSTSLSLDLFLAYDWLPTNLVKNRICHSCFKISPQFNLPLKKIFILQTKRIIVCSVTVLLDHGIVGSSKALVCHLNEKS
jgi:hypothetical protein